MKYRRKGKLAIICCSFIIACLIFEIGLRACGSDEPEHNAESTHYPDLDKVGLSKDISSIEKDYTGFRLSFNPDYRIPNWVSWELLANETEGETKRSNKFWSDTSVENCPDVSDYKKSGYDRGHMCPAADQKWSQQAMTDCFVLTNVTPQDKSLNSGAWNKLEAQTRIWAQRDSALVIVAGPVFNSERVNTIGDGVRVPDAFFKVLLAPYVKKPRAIGFVYPNMSAPGHMQNYVMSVDEVEELTGFDFFYNLPDSLENAVESKVSFRAWMDE